MKPYFLFLSLLLSGCYFIPSAQALTISGKVIDQSTQEPLEFATISILDATTQVLVAGETTDAQGLFRLRVQPGTYDIKVEFLSFKSYVLVNQDIQENLELPTIELAPNVTQLEGVEVVEERSTVEYQLDKKVFNVGKDISSQGGTITDILDNVPSVSVDAEGTISLRGNANVRILINGKPSVLTANNGLEQLPSDMIEKVEVITNPSARYEASGTAGIINLVLKKNKLQGLGLSLRLTSGYPANHQANLNANYKTSQLNLFTNIGYRYANFFGETTRNQSVQSNGLTQMLQQREDQQRNDDHYNVYFGGDYYFNDKNTLTLTYYHDKIVNTDRTELDYHFSHGQGTVDSIINQVENYREPQNFNQLQIEYNKTFDKKGQKWSSSLVYDFWNDDENEQITRNYLSPSTGTQRNILTRDIESSKDLLFQSDYTLPLSEKAQLEAGFRGELRRITSDYSASINGEFLPDFNNVMDYDERIMGAYVQYSNQIKKLNYLLGLRSEYSYIGIADQDNRFSDTKKYINFFPTAHLTYQFSEQFNMQLSYSRRINRPRFWQLNPFGGLSDIRNLFAGNPDLDPMYTDSYELGLLKRWEKFTLNPSIYFQRSTEFFQFLTTQNEAGNFFTMPVNLSDENRLGIEISTSYSPSKWLRLSAEMNYFQFQQNGTFEGVDLAANDDLWTGRINSRMRFDKGLSIQTTYRYIGQQRDGQGFNKAQQSLDFSFSKDLFGDAANIALNFRNLLDSRVFERTITEENFQLQYRSKRIGRRISATFTYRFNRKKNER
ncbi:MAG: TonB-dependent receptor, partial [Bacteroidota bacterium]